jgi:hypothetical protein
MTSGSLLGSATNDSTGLVQKELPVTQGRFRIRVDRHDDGLNVGAAPAFARHPVSKLGQAFHPWRIVPIVPLRGSVTMNNLPGLCPSQARLFFELVPFGTACRSDRASAPGAASLGRRNASLLKLPDVPHVDARQTARSSIDWSAMRQCRNRSCQEALQFSPELLPMSGKASSLCRARNSRGSPVVGNAVSRHSPDLSTPTKMT